MPSRTNERTYAAAAADPIDDLARLMTSLAGLENLTSLRRAHALSALLLRVVFRLLLVLNCKSCCFSFIYHQGDYCYCVRGGFRAKNKTISLIVIAHLFCGGLVYRKLQFQ